MLKGLRLCGENTAALSRDASKTSIQGVSDKLDSNFRSLVDASKADARSSESLKVMERVIAASFAFDILDCIWPGGSNIEAKGEMMTLVSAYGVNTGAWPVVSILWALFFMYLLSRLSAQLESSAMGAISAWFIINSKTKLRKLRRFLSQFKIVQEEIRDGEHKVKYIDHLTAQWKGCCPEITIVYDRENSYVYRVNVSIVDQERRFNVRLIRIIISGVLNREGVVDRSFAKPPLGNVRRKMNILKLLEPKIHPG